MDSPNPVLMHYYGNEKVAVSRAWLAKTIGQAKQTASPARVVEFGNKAFARGSKLDDASTSLWQQGLRGTARKVERMAGKQEAAGRLAYRAPDTKQAAVPEDMTFLASIAAQAGADLAKSAGIVGSVAGTLVKSPLARKAVGLGAIAGGGLLAAKAIKTVPKLLGSEGAGPKTFGSGNLGFNPAGSVNSYGQPQVGSSIT